MSMVRPTFRPVFEETEAAIRDRILSRISDEWRKEPGDFIYDAVAAVPLEIKQAQINQDTILKQSFAQYAEGEYLDAKLAEVGLERTPATKAQRKLQITADAGVVIPAGHTASSVVLDSGGNPLEFQVTETVTFNNVGTLEVHLTAAQPGSQYNIKDGSEFILLPPIPGVRKIVDVGVTVPGADEESDESAWKRYDFKVRNPDTGGNKNDYVRWAQEVPGVGKAKCIPRWNGVNTVKVLLVGTDYTPAAQEIVDDVQEYLDPGGLGVGDGKAPLGAAVTVAPATALPINVEVTGIQYSIGADPIAVKAAFEKSLIEYIQSLVFEIDPITKTAPPVLYNRIMGLLTFTPGVNTFTGITVNGGTVDVPVGDEEVPVFGSVTGL